MKSITTEVTTTDERSFGPPPPKTNIEPRSMVIPGGNLPGQFWSLCIAFQGGISGISPDFGENVEEAMVLLMQVHVIICP